MSGETWAEVETGEIVYVADADEARRLTDRIKVAVEGTLTDAAHDLLDHVQRFQSDHGQKVKPLTRMRAGMLAEALILEVDGKPEPVPSCSGCAICREVRS